jgi:V8-like Glu-specific endopeptidase
MTIHQRVCWLILISLGAQSSAAVFDSDDRLQVDNAVGSVFSPIGVVYPASKTHYATGFLVDACHVLTVKHVVGDNASAENKQLFFSAGPRTLKGGWTAKGQVVADGKFNLKQQARQPGQGRVRDWILLRLDKCLGEKVGYLVLADAQLGAGYRVASAGFPLDRSLDYPSLDPNCKIRTPLGATVLHDCASRKGSSGAPIFNRIIQNGRPQVEVVAMHSAGVPDRGVRPFDYAYSSIAIPIRAILADIQPYLNLPPNPGSQENPRLLKS